MRIFHQLKAFSVLLKIFSRKPYEWETLWKSLNELVIAPLVFNLRFLRIFFIPGPFLTSHSVRKSAKTVSKIIASKISNIFPKILHLEGFSGRKIDWWWFLSSITNRAARFLHSGIAMYSFFSIYFHKNDDIGINILFVVDKSICDVFETLRIMGLPDIS